MDKVDFETTIDSTKATFYRTIKVRKTSPKTSPKNRTNYIIYKGR